MKIRQSSFKSVMAAILRANAGQETPSGSIILTRMPKSFGNSNINIKTSQEQPKFTPTGMI